MGTLNLAAASLGAAAPVPSAQDAPSKAAPGFADVLAGVTDNGSPADAAAAGPARHARPGKGQPVWAALEQLARQLALSAGGPIPGAGDPKAAKAPAEAGAGEPAEPERDADGASPPAILGGTVPTPIVPAARVLGADGAVVIEAAPEQTEPEAFARLAHEVERSTTHRVAAALDEPVTSEATGDRRAEPAVKDDAIVDVERPIGREVEASAETSTAAANGLALGTTPSPASLSAPAPPVRSHRADVEAFREWAATAARAPSPVAAGAGAVPATATEATAPLPPPSAATELAGALGADATAGGNSAGAIGERGRNVGRTPEVGRAVVARFKANEGPGEAAPPASPRTGAKPADVATPSGNRPRTAVAPQTHFEVPALPGQLTATRAATPVSSAAQAPIELDGGLESQIVQAVKVQWGRDGGEARIRLQPHYLGELMISLRVEQGGVTAHLVASAPEVRQWIESNEAVLRQSLAQHDLTLERLIVTEEEPSASMSEEDPRQPDPRRPAKRQARRGDRDATFEVIV